MGWQDLREAWISPLASPTIWAAWALAIAGLILARRRSPYGPALVLSSSLISVLWATLGWNASLRSVSCGTTLDHFLRDALAGACAATMPLLCAVVARLPARAFWLGVVLPWIDYTLLTLVTLELLTMPWGGGGGWMWQSLTR